MGLERKRRRRERGTGWGKGFTYASLADGLDMGGGCVGSRRLVSPTLRPAQGLFKRVQACSSPVKSSQALASPGPLSGIYGAVALAMSVSWGCGWKETRA